MLQRPKSVVRRIVAIALCSTLQLPSALAQTLNTTVSCMRGEVEAYDYAELSENFREGTWDTRGGVELQADFAEVTLKVVNLAGQSVCENVADLQTRCAFRLRTGDDFTIIIDNTMRSSSTSYRLCAF